MPADTPNHELQEYSIGEEGWTHTPDMSTIDERLPIAFDARENRSDYEPFQGAIYWALDTGELFRGDGSDWGDAVIDAGDLLISGDGVATESYVDTEVSNVDTGGDPMEVHGNDWHDPSFASVADLTAHESDTDNIHGIGDSGFASNADVQDAIDQHVADYEHGGSGGVDQTWVEDHVDDEIGIHANVIDAHHSRYTDDESRAAVDGSGVSVDHANTAEDADNATFWDNYELVFDDESPSTSQYIRLEEGT